MMPATLQPSADLNEDVSALIEVLHQTVKRLEN